MPSRKLDILPFAQAVRDELVHNPHKNEWDCLSACWILNQLNQHGQNIQLGLQEVFKNPDAADTMRQTIKDEIAQCGVVLALLFNSVDELVDQIIEQVAQQRVLQEAMQAQGPGPGALAPTDEGGESRPLTEDEARQRGLRLVTAEELDESLGDDGVLEEENPEEELQPPPESKQPGDEA